jgi:hypothetical protein
MVRGPKGLSLDECLSRLAKMGSAGLDVDVLTGAETVLRTGVELEFHPSELYASPGLPPGVTFIYKGDREGKFIVHGDMMLTAATSGVESRVWRVPFMGESIRAALLTLKGYVGGREET